MKKNWRPTSHQSPDCKSRQGPFDKGPEGWGPTSVVPLDKGGWKRDFKGRPTEGFDKGGWKGDLTNTEGFTHKGAAILFLLCAALTAAFIGCGDCTTATEKTYNYTPAATLRLATEPPSCPKADERFSDEHFTVDTAAIIAKLGGGSASYAPAEGEAAKPDYIPDTISVGPYTKCLIHTEKADPHTDCAPNNYFKLFFGVSQEEIEEIYFISLFGLESLNAVIKTPLTDGTGCTFYLYEDLNDGASGSVECYNPKNTHPSGTYSFIWHAPQ